MLSATSTLLGYHVGLVRNGGGVAVELNHTHVVIRYGHAAEAAVQRLSTLDVAVQQDGVVVAVAQREAARSFAVVNVGCCRFQQVLLQRHGETLKVTLGDLCWSVLVVSCRPLRSFHCPSTQHSL